MDSKQVVCYGLIHALACSKNWRLRWAGVTPHMEDQASIFTELRTSNIHAPFGIRTWVQSARRYAANHTGIQTTYKLYKY
jgi:hypothetical protein